MWGRGELWAGVRCVGRGTNMMSNVDRTNVGQIVVLYLYLFHVQV